MYISSLFPFFSAFAMDGGYLGLSEANDSRRSESSTLAGRSSSLLPYLYDGINDPLWKYDKPEGRDASFFTRAVLIPQRFTKEFFRRTMEVSRK
jgi:hypothetical protein